MKLRNLGNYQHNIKVLKNGGELIRSRRISKKTADRLSLIKDLSTAFLPCEHCLGFFNRREFCRYVKDCDAKSHVSDQKYKKVIANSLLLLPTKEEVSKEFSNNTLNDMKTGTVKTCVFENDLLLKYGSKLYEKYKIHSRMKNYVREKLRLLAAW